MEQLTLFELDSLPPEPIPAFFWQPAPIEMAPPPAKGPGPPRLRRRKAWLPRLVRWVTARAARATT